MIVSGNEQHIDTFNTKLEERLDDTNFMFDGVARFDSAYLYDVNENNENPGVISERGITPPDEDYGDMIMGEQPEVDDEEAVDKIF